MNTRDTVRDSRSLAYDMEEWWGDGGEGKSPRQQRPRHRAQNLPPVVKPVPGAGRAQRRKAKTHNRALMYMTFGVLAACLFLQVNRYAQIALQTKEISKLAGEISSLEADRANLELRLSARENIQRVRDEAMYKLGMDYPAEGQVRVIALDQNAGTQMQTAANSADSAQ